MERPNFVKVKHPTRPHEFLWLHVRDYVPGGRWELYVEDAPAGHRSAPTDAAMDSAPSPAATPSTPSSNEPPAPTSGNDLTAYDVTPTPRGRTPTRRRG